MTILRSGSSEKYSQNWAAAFGDDAAVAPASKSGAKKATKKKTVSKVAKKETKPKAAKKSKKK